MPRELIVVVHLTMFDTNEPTTTKRLRERLKQVLVDPDQSGQDLRIADVTITGWGPHGQR